MTQFTRLKRLPKCEIQFQNIQQFRHLREYQHPMPRRLTTDIHCPSWMTRHLHRHRLTITTTNIDLSHGTSKKIFLVTPSFLVTLRPTLSLGKIPSKAIILPHIRINDSSMGRSLSWQNRYGWLHTYKNTDSTTAHAQMIDLTPPFAAASANSDRPICIPEATHPPYDYPLEHVPNHEILSLCT